MVVEIRQISKFGFGIDWVVVETDEVDFSGNPLILDEHIFRHYIIKSLGPSKTAKSEMMFFIVKSVMDKISTLSFDDWDKAIFNQTGFKDNQFYLQVGTQILILNLRTTHYAKPLVKDVNASSRIFEFRVQIHNRYQITPFVRNSLGDKTIAFRGIFKVGKSLISTNTSFNKQLTYRKYLLAVFDKEGSNQPGANHLDYTNQYAKLLETSTSILQAIQKYDT